MFSIDKNLGPKLIMIKEMMRDLGYFAMILFTFMTAFGIATQSILNPSTPASFDLFKEVFRKAYFLIYAELFLEEYEGNPNSREYRSDYASKLRKWERKMVQSYLSRQHKPDSNDKDLINQLTLKVEEKFSKLCSQIDQLTLKEEELQQQLNNSQDENSQNIEEKFSKLCSQNDQLTLKVKELQHNDDEKMKNIDTSLAWIKENLMETKR
ncbi:Hypothetical predicted protein [Octopus vulgaris]|uniref:Uncharacterized protein n=1 Tax=Octopus vulgaris TaxID=6645 RepID=A0AA36BK60_OCTVU|nr:Hypothetical predicted protein [Octopus vulgaris]